MKTDYWRCDVCGGKIHSADDGWVEWVKAPVEPGTTYPRKGRDLRLVHAALERDGKRMERCQFVSTEEYEADGGLVSDLSQRDFMGPNGLMLLLSLIADDRIPKEDGIEMVKRLHIPGYEVARRYLSRAASENVFEPNTLEGFPYQSQIESVLEWVEEEGFEEED